MVTTTTIAGYNEKNETVTTISGEESVGTLDVGKSVKTATFSMNIINNYENIAKNVKILGRIPTSNNKDVETKENLGSNISLNLQSKLQLSGISEEKYTIYYSKNETATKDITLVANAWETSPENLQEIKSYLIVFNDYEMNTGDIVQVKYNISIPEKLEYNKNAYSNYVVYFDNVKEDETIQDKQKSARIGLSTKEGPNLKVEMGIDRKGDIEEASIVTYKVSVKNEGNKELSNVTLTGSVPKGTTYIAYEIGHEDGIKYPKKEEYSEVINKIKPGETKTIFYQVEVNTLGYNENEKTIQANGKATVENYELEFKSQPVESKIVPSYLILKMETSPQNIEKREGQTNIYMLTIKNITMKPKENVVLTNKLPDGISFVSANEGGEYNEATNTVTWNLGTVNAKSVKYITLETKINNLQNGETKKEISNIMTLKTNEKELTTNETKFTVIKPILTITRKFYNIK